MELYLYSPSTPLRRAQEKFCVFYIYEFETSLCNFHRTYLSTCLKLSLRWFNSPHRKKNCNISVIQQDAQYLMINFIRNIQYLNMFRVSIVHLQERSYAVCCSLVCLDKL